MAFNTDNFNNVSSGGGSTIKIWSYINTSDTLATIMGASYFNGRRFALNQNDVIFIIGSDGSELVRVTSAVNASSVTVTAYDAVPAGTITNADVSAGAAIDFSKLAALATGELIVGNAGVPTAAALSGDATISAAGALSLAVNIPRTETIAVTAAEFLGMYATPKLLVAAGGANTLHIVQNVVFEVDYGGTQFANGGVVAVQYDSTANGAGPDATADTAAAVFTAITADTAVGAVGELPSTASASLVNKGLYLSNETAAFITGDSDIYVHLTYSTVTTVV